MKTKNKTLALVEIAIVLCSVFLVAIPVIAADQTMQKAITTASDDDYALGIYGNANEDDTIDMRDTTYIKLVIFGKKPKTDLADANYDGKISMLDVGQTKLIILDKEKKLTVVSCRRWEGDHFAVTVHKPINRVITRFFDSAEVLRILNVADKIVATGTKSFQENSLFFPELSKLPYVAAIRYGPDIDYEAVLSINPDIFFAWTGVEREKLPGIPIVHSKLWGLGSTNDVRKLGYIFDKEEEVEEYIDWHDGWINMIEEQVEAIPEDELPLVAACYIRSDRVWALYGAPGGTRGMDDMITMVPMNIIGQALPKGGYNIDIEWLIEKNPDIIVIVGHAANPPSFGYDVDDPSQMIALREHVLSRPELAGITAVKEGKVYVMGGKLFFYSQSMIIGAVYLAKWLYPDLDLDPEAVHREYIDRFQHIDFNLDEHGVFVYPPIEVNGDLAGIPNRYKG